MLHRRVLLSSLLTSACLPALAAPDASGHDVWRIVTEYPASAMPGEGIATFAAAVAALTNGRLTVQAGFDAPDGLKSAAMLKAVADRRVDAADAFTGALAGEAAIFQLSALPFLTASTADAAKLLRVARPAYEEALAARGLTLLYATPWPPTGLWSRNPAPDLAALQGMRIRTYDAAGTAILQAVGAAPVQISFADAMPRLKAGDLDAVLSSGDGGAGAKLWDLLPNFTVLDYASPLSLAFCNTAALAALPTATRDAIRQAAATTERRQFDAMATRVAENEVRMKANGVVIAAVPALRRRLAQAAAPVIAAWEMRAGPAGSAILAAYRA